jgi:hypothetical protein
MAPQTVLKLPSELSGVESRPQIILKVGKLMKFSGLEKGGRDRERETGDPAQHLRQMGSDGAGSFSQCYDA